MKCKVVYASKTGNTKKVADAIASAIGIEAFPLDAFDATEACDLLFLGGAVYGGELSPEMKGFIESLDPKKVARVAVFCTAVMGEKANDLMKGLLYVRGIPVVQETLACKGKFLWMNRKCPNDVELARAREYAERMAKQ